MSSTPIVRPSLEAFLEVKRKSPLWRHICRDLILSGKLDLATFKFENPLECYPVGEVLGYLTPEMKAEVKKERKWPADHPPHVNKGKKRIRTEDGHFKWVNPEDLPAAEEKKEEAEEKKEEAAAEEGEVKE